MMMKSKVGISSFAFRWATNGNYLSSRQPLDAAGVLRRSVALGAEVVQLCENVPLLDLPVDRLKELRKVAESAGVEIEVGFRGLSESALLNAIRVCELVGASVLRVVIGEGPDALERSAIVRTLREHSPALSNAGLVLAIENHFRFTPRAIAGIVEEVGDESVGVCLDPFNSFTHFVSPEETVDRLSRYAVSVHLKDATIRRMNTGFYVSGTPLGAGKLDIGHVLRAVQKHGHVTSLLVEAWMDHGEEEAQTLRMEEEWIAGGMNYVRRHR